MLSGNQPVNRSDATPTRYFLPCFTGFEWRLPGWDQLVRKCTLCMFSFRWAWRAASDSMTRSSRKDFSIFIEWRIRWGWCDDCWLLAVVCKLRYRGRYPVPTSRAPSGYCLCIFDSDHQTSILGGHGVTRLLAIDLA